ncbi:signal transduction histidine kinase [Afipia carboxidovorans OM5]|uniref:histidine kinase n=1 Tax=Afipia carboxidovorans (strain ATCC 49405 / DSM 1227 / KCTC 32145 / OM5) TaxID=504832 RepID=B6JJB7_AFIC5|nr:HWE histidine kinase domain-containing protein [Afipia carboxidovorans]ACI94511.1 signal transduction histidine kinase [Afipia carboxidovorans OM5]AEI01868.1 signal transduction histidine hinase [Afipia carboxidovorans OM4]AEI05443.1 signal transduction histidine hinase [Afipia carboxidovorans OM5]
MLRVGFFIGLIAVIGVLVSGLVSYRIYEQESVIDRTALVREIDAHASLVQERLSEREVLARVSAGVFRPSTAISARALQPLRSSIYVLKTDFVMTGWIARLLPSDFAAAEAELKSADFQNPQIRSFDDAPIAPAVAAKGVDVLMDVEPQDATTMSQPGRAYDQDPVIGPMLAKAAATGAPTASDPLRLLPPDRPLGIVLAVPVMREETNSLLGFVATSYRLSLMLSNDDLSLFAVALRDPRSASTELALEGGEIVSTAARSDDDLVTARNVSFGGRDWTLDYYAKTDTTQRAQNLALVAGLIGLAVTAVLCSLFGYVSYNNVRLSREIEARIGFERRLTAVIDELNHRVKNILAVIQSIVTRTLRHGTDIDIARELLIGRIHAMSNVVTLLSDSQWQGVKLKGLFDSRAIPHGDRIALDGPDITVSARAAQSLSLLFFELASHSDEGLSLVGKHPHIVANWTVTGEGQEAVFKFHWEEFNTSIATRRPESDFGIVLLDRVAPEALGGTSKRYFTDVSYVYELTAPMVTVVDENEKSRTSYIVRATR